MPITDFRPKPGRFGVSPVLLNSGQIGGTNYLGGASPLTANTNTVFRLGGTAGRKCRASRFGATVVTVPADADGSLFALLTKHDASTNSTYYLTDSINLETLLSRKETSVPMLSTLTDAQLTLLEGDSLEVTVTSNSAAIDTQPAGLVFTVELLVQE